MKTLITLASLLATSIAMACSSDQLCIGDRIIDSQSYVGTVLEVFSNGKTKISLDGGPYSSYLRDTSSLGKGVKCHNNICVDDRIINGQGYSGKVLEVFNNGKARVYFDGSSYSSSISNISELGKAFRCIENLCVNDRIVDSKNMTGTVLEIFDTGKVKVHLDGSSYSSTVRTFSELGIELTCSLRETCSRRN